MQKCNTLIRIRWNLVKPTTRPWACRSSYRFTAITQRRGSKRLRRLWKACSKLSNPIKRNVTCAADPCRALSLSHTHTHMRARAHLHSLASVSDATSSQSTVCAVADTAVNSARANRSSDNAGPENAGPNRLLKARHAHCHCLVFMSLL